MLHPVYINFLLPVSVILFIGGLDDGERLRNIISVTTRGRVILPGYPAILRVRVLFPRIMTELFINGKTLRTRRTKLETNIGDIIGLV